MYKQLAAWLVKGIIVLTAIGLLSGLGATVYELRKVNASLNAIQQSGLGVYGQPPEAIGGLLVRRPVNVSGAVDVTGRVDVGSIRNTVNIAGDVDVNRVRDTVRITGRITGDVDVNNVFGTVEVEGQVDVSSCNTRFVGCDPIEVIIVR